jgi:hypothetical protein
MAAATAAAAAAAATAGWAVGVGLRLQVVAHNSQMVGRPVAQSLGSVPFKLLLLRYRYNSDPTAALGELAAGGSWPVSLAFSNTLDTCMSHGLEGVYKRKPGHACTHLQCLHLAAVIKEA